MNIFSLLPQTFGGAPTWNPSIDTPTHLEERLLQPLNGRRVDALRVASLRVAASDPVAAARAIAQRSLRSAVSPYYAQELSPVTRFSVQGLARTIDHDRGIAPQVVEFDLLFGEALGRSSLTPLLTDALSREFRTRHFAARVAAASALLILAVYLPELPR